MAETESPRGEVQKTRRCRFYMSWNGCREGDHCAFKHDDDIPQCKYYKYGCWNGRWCSFRHGDPQEKCDTQHFYQELNRWLGPSKLDESTCSNMNDSLLIEAAKGPNPEKKYVSRATQTKTTPEFIHCGECGEEFKSGRTIQQSLERHYIHMLASADFYHIRFFRRHPELRRNDALCAACGEVFRTIESLLQHMGARVSGMSQDSGLRVEHQNWFKQLVQPFVYRDLEVLETDDDLVQRIKEVYFVKASDESSTLIAESEDESPVKTMISAKKKKGTSKPKADTNNNDESYDECTSSYVYCEECGEVLDEPDGDRKLRLHYEDKLACGGKLHVQLFQTNSALSGQAMCRVCSKAFPTPIALLQHIGSKKKLAEDSHTGSSIQHGELLTEIAEIFTERDLGVEGCCAEEQVVERLVAIVTPAGRRKSLDTSISNPDTAEKRKANVDDTLEMARYFCQVNKWQARMSYAEYVSDDHERTRNNGFTVGEVEFLTSKGIPADSPAAFKMLNTIYKKRNSRGPLKSQKNRRRQSRDVRKSSITQSAPSADKEKEQNKSVVPTRKASTTESTETSAKDDEKPTLQSSTSVNEADGQTKKETGGDQSPKPKRKKQRRRSSRSNKPDDKTAGGENEGKKVKEPVSGGAKPKSRTASHAKRLALLKRKREARERAIPAQMKMLFQVDTDGRVYIHLSTPSKEEILQKQMVVYKDPDLLLNVPPPRPEAPVFIAHENGCIVVKAETEVVKCDESGTSVLKVDSVDGNVSGKKELGLAESVGKKEVPGLAESVELTSVLTVTDNDKGIPTKIGEESSVNSDVNALTIEEEKKSEAEEQQKAGDVVEEQKPENEQPGKETPGPTQPVKNEQVADDGKEPKDESPKVEEDANANEVDVQRDSQPLTHGGVEESLKTEAVKTENGEKEVEAGRESDTPSPEKGKVSSVVQEKVRQIELGLLNSQSKGERSPGGAGDTTVKPRVTDEINNNLDSEKIQQEVDSCACIQSTGGEESGRTAV